MPYTRPSDDSAMTPAGSDSLVIDTLEVDFPESSERAGRIFGNAAHNIPVRIRFKIIDTANNDKDVSEQYKNKIHLYDVSANRSIPDGTLNDVVSEALVAAGVANEFTLGIYGKPSASPAPQDTGGLAEMTFYVRTRQLLTTMKDFEVGAYLALNGETTPDGKMVSSGDKKSVSLAVLPPINYADPGQWSVDDGATASLTPDGGMDLHGVDVSQVTFCRRQFSLQHSMLKDNSPVKLTVNNAWTGYYTPMHPSGLRTLASALFTDIDRTTGKQEARGMCWLAPEGGVTYTMQPMLVSSHGADDGKFMHAGLKRPMTLFSAGSDVNSSAAFLTLIQGEMVIHNDTFTVPGGATVNSGSLSLSDNVGHHQTVQITCDTSTGKPYITGKG